MTLVIELHMYERWEQTFSNCSKCDPYEREQLLWTPRILIPSHVVNWITVFLKSKRICLPFLHVVDMWHSDIHSRNDLTSSLTDTLTDDVKISSIINISSAYITRVALEEIFTDPSPPQINLDLILTFARHQMAPQL